jgi:effector-binding domain-containing protein
MDETQTNEAELAPRAPQRILSIRGTIPVAQLGDVMGKRMEALSAALKTQGVRADGPLFARYHTFDRDGDTDVEHGVFIGGDARSGGDILSGELPGGDAVTIWHLGDHTTLGTTYGKMGAKVTASGREPAGPPWEEYHWIDLNQFDTAAALQNDPSTWRVLLVQPLK